MFERCWMFVRMVNRQHGGPIRMCNSPAFLRSLRRRTFREHQAETGCVLFEWRERLWCWASSFPCDAANS